MEFPGATGAGKMAEDWGLAEERALNMTPFPPLSPDLPPKNQQISNRYRLQEPGNRQALDDCPLSPGDEGRARDVSHGPFGQIKDMEPDLGWRYGPGRGSGVASGGAEGAEADGEGHGSELG